MENEYASFDKEWCTKEDRENIDNADCMTIVDKIRVVKQFEFEKQKAQYWSKACLKILGGSSRPMPIEGRGDRGQDDI